MPNLHIIEAQVHKKLESGGYRVKVSVLDDDIRMYVNGTRVFPPNGEKDWSVQTPGIPNSKDKAVSFDGKSSLWAEYKKACIEAVQEYMRQEKMGSNEDEDMLSLSESEFNKKLMEDIEKLGF